MRPIWKGAIGFGLVNIPIALYPAARREELKLRFLRASDLSPVNYKRVALVSVLEKSIQETGSKTGARAATKSKGRSKTTRRSRKKAA